MSDSEDWDLPDLDAIMRGEKKHEWLSDPRFNKMFSDIEDGLQGVLGKGTYDWVDRRVFDAVFDKSTLMALHKLMQKGDIETCLLYTSPSPRDLSTSRMPSSA